MPPVPPVSPVPPTQPIPPHTPKDKEKDRAPKVPVTFLGVETSSVPRVVSEQLNLPKGFGLVVDYVVPDGPAAAAGVQQNDILKMLNDQILMEPDQLSKLIRSYQEGTNVTLTILRKNAETKITVKLGKKEVRQRDRDFGMMDSEDFNEKMKDFNEKMKDFKVDFNSDAGPDIRETVRTAQREAARARAEARDRAREQVQRVREEAQRTREQAQRAREDAQRAREDARRSSREMRVFSQDKGTMKSTTIDLGKATIVFSDDKGELKLETVAGKKILTAKDPQGKLLFSGPVDSKEEIDKMPPEVRERFNKLEVTDLPGVVPNTFVDREDLDDQENDNDNDNDKNDEEDNDEADSSTDVSNALQSVSEKSVPRSFNIVSI
ncbi:MAG: PDZ domain-containing protein [Verrucomicrobiaceae bacterium]|nr:PDZ domain-containing protein [Verrucomicrobiaceae bacterium]